MKKSGFTLAEVLITLGIVGVVSALVLPTFTTKMQTAKVGPRLAKAVAGFEQANIAILDDAQSDSLSGASVRINGAQTVVLGSVDNYFAALGTHMKGSYDNGRHKFYAADGAMYCLAGATNRTLSPTPATPVNANCTGSFNAENGNIPHLNPIAGNTSSVLMIDIDGNNGPNMPGRDLFFFQMMDDGSLRPWGGSWENSANRWHLTSETGKCERNQQPATTGDYVFCAGHVMENGLKVEYK